MTEIKDKGRETRLTQLGENFATAYGNHLNDPNLKPKFENDITSSIRGKSEEEIEKYAVGIGMKPEDLKKLLEKKTS